MLQESFRKLGQLCDGGCVYDCGVDVDLWLVSNSEAIRISIIESCKIQVERGEQKYSILKVARSFEEYGKGGLQGRRYGKKEGEWVGKKKVKVRLGKVR